MKKYKVKVNGKLFEVELESVEESKATISAPKAEAPKATASTGAKAVEAPIQGTVLKVAVSVGQKVKKGDVVAVVEAMKLENDVVSPFDGEVAEVLVSKGQTVATKQALITIR